jgi:hypothetical protein
LVGGVVVGVGGVNVASRRFALQQYSYFTGSIVPYSEGGGERVNLLL